MRRGEYTAFAFTFLGASLGADRSLYRDQQLDNNERHEGHSRRNVIMFEQIAKDITEKAKGPTSIERLLKPTTNVIDLNLRGWLMELAE